MAARWRIGKAGREAVVMAGRVRAVVVRENRRSILKTVVWKCGKSYFTAPHHTITIPRVMDALCCIGVVPTPLPAVSSGAASGQELSALVLTFVRYTTQIKLDLLSKLDDGGDVDVVGKLLSLKSIAVSRVRRSTHRQGVPHSAS